MEYDFDFTATDKQVMEELKDFVPDRIFDSHTHVFRFKDLHIKREKLFPVCPEETDISTWAGSVGRMLGKVPKGAFFMPYPGINCDIGAANGFLIDQLAGYPDSRGLILVAPGIEKSSVEDMIEDPRIVGFKPYYVFSTAEPKNDSPIDAFIPEWVWETADERGMMIILHLVKKRALDDPDNQTSINEKCRKYPNAKLILAHAGRGFHSLNTVKGCKTLRGLDNVWFDMSGICESAPIKAVLNEFGPKKLLWGSDFPVSQIRGRCVTIGDSFVWNQPDTVRWEDLPVDCNPILVGIESIRALKEASDDFGLCSDDIKDIFYNNAISIMTKKERTTQKAQKLYERAKAIIPGGVQLLSKRPEMFAPGQWPAYFSEARGCEVWDIDGNHYFDMSSSSVGACMLGYRDPDVTSAVTRRIKLGNMSMLNPPEEVYLAEKLIEIHPWAKQVRYARTGGEIGAVAVRIARATTDRSMVAISGYHGWHDWYLAANLGESDALRGHLLPGLEPYGVPVELRGTSVTFEHGDLKGFMDVMERYGSMLAAVIMEPCRYNDPDKGFLDLVREETARRGIILIFDEITIGWRRNFGGSHLGLGVYPDVAIFAKALGNGHPIAAVIGTEEAMEGAHRSFISSTYWTESVGPAAALAVIEKHREADVSGHAWKIGDKVAALWRQHGAKHKLPVVVPDGYPCLAHFMFDHALSMQLKTLYIQMMLERGFLAGPSIYPTYAHNDEVVGMYGRAVDEVFGEIARHLEAGTVKDALKGPAAHTGFKRLI